MVNYNLKKAYRYIWVLWLLKRRRLLHSLSRNPVNTPLNRILMQHNIIYLRIKILIVNSVICDTTCSITPDTTVSETCSTNWAVTMISPSSSELRFLVFLLCISGPIATSNLTKPNNRWSGHIQGFFFRKACWVA